MLLFIPDWVYVEKKSRKCVKEITRKCYQGNFKDLKGVKSFLLLETKDRTGRNHSQSNSRN